MICYIDKFETLPRLIDCVTPQGRPIPTTQAEVNGNQATPITGENPKLQLMPQIGNQTISSNADIVKGQAVKSSVDSLSTNPNLGSSLGEKDAGTENHFEDFLKKVGGKAKSVPALSRLCGGKTEQIPKTLEQQSNPETLIPDDIRLDTFGVEVEGLGGFIDYVNNPLFTTPIYDPSNVLSLIKDSQEVEVVPPIHVGGLTIRFCPLVLPRLPKLPKFPGLPKIHIRKPKLPKLPDIDLFDGVPCIPLIPSLTDVSRIAQFNQFITDIYNVPEKVAGAVDKEIGIYRDAIKNDIGQIKLLMSIRPGSATSKTFIDAGAKEGTTPPLKGAYGGPNYSGASPNYEPPSNLAADKTKYPGGSTTPIKTEPPADWEGDKATAAENISLLIAAADGHSFSNEQKATFLAIVGGDCGWIPSEGNDHFTDPKRLMEMFASTFKGDITVAEEYCNWVKGGKGKKGDFWNFVNDTCNHGRKIGNTQPGDGAKYIDRGFIQIGGRANYEKYAKLSGYKIDEDPEMLVDDEKVAAEVAALFFLDRVKNIPPTAHPQFFYAACRVVGKNYNGNLTKKRKYYEWFYGTKTPESYSYTEKSAGAQSPFSFQNLFKGNG